MKENKGTAKKKNNGNVRINNFGTGLYSHKVQNAILNGLTSSPDIDYNSLTEENKEKWNDIYEEEKRRVKKEGDKEDVELLSQATNLLSFYNITADQIKFTTLHTIVLIVLEEMYNQQSIDNIYNWRKGNNGKEYKEMGYVYTNPNQLAKYIWGYSNPKNVKQVANILEDLARKKVYLSRVERKSENNGKKGEEDNEYTIIEVNLLITRGIKIKEDKKHNKKGFYSFVQLHPIFFENIGRNNIRHRNNLYQMLRDYNNSLYASDKSKQKYKLPSDSTIYMSLFLSKFTRMKVFSLTLDEETIAQEINIKEFNYKNLSRGRDKIKNALNALHSAGMIKQWNEMTGRSGQQQYYIELNKDFFGCKEITETDKIK